MYCSGHEAWCICEYVSIILPFFLQGVATSKPRPTATKKSSLFRPTLRQLSGALQPVSANWRMLGIRLGLTYTELGTIRKDRCMDDLLSKWLQKYPNKGWSNIISALRKLDRNDVADRVESQFSSPSSGMAVMGGSEIQ